MQADILGIPVLVSAHEEATALGAAICAGVGIGVWPDLDTGANDVACFTTVEPRAREHALYEPYYRRWLRLFEIRTALDEEVTWGPRASASS